MYFLNNEKSSCRQWNNEHVLEFARFSSMKSSCGLLTKPSGDLAEAPEKNTIRSSRLTTSPASVVTSHSKGNAEDKEQLLHSTIRKSNRTSRRYTLSTIAICSCKCCYGISRQKQPLNFEHITIMQDFAYLKFLQQHNGELFKCLELIKTDCWVE